MNNKDLEKAIKVIINVLAEEKGYICSIDVLIKLEYLSKTDYENWRRGKIDYLERVCNTNLNKLKTINQIIRRTTIKMGFKPSLTVYNKWGKGTKNRLRFCKSGLENIEKAYSTHYVDENKINELKRNDVMIPANEK